MFQAVQIAYWLALSTWFGGVLFVAAAAPVIFRTVRASDPTLPGAALDGEDATLLAGDIVDSLLDVLVRAELACAAVAGLAVLAQWFVADRTGGALVAVALRSGLLVAAAGVVLYDWRVVRPRTRQHRAEFLRLADDPDAANAAREQFDRYHAEGVNLLLALLFLLLGMILFSGTIAPASVTYVF